VEVCRDIKLPPAPHDPYECRAESVEYFSDSFMAHFVAMFPVLKTTITIFYPTTLLNVEVSLSCDDAQLVRTPLENGARWSIYTPLLHGHTIATRWSKVAAQPSQTAHAGA
jgi:hypothetical protein